MSKVKLAVLLFCVAFGVNIAAFVFSKKALTIDELKNVWLYELPPSLSPLDASTAPTFGPHSGLIGTLFLPAASTLAGKDGGEVLENALAERWAWNDRARELRVTLKSGLQYSDESPITAADWVESIRWAQGRAAPLAVSPEWAAFVAMEVAAPDAQTLVLSWKQLPQDFDFVHFAQHVLTHPLAGVYHPANLARLKAGEKIVSKWISSGPYRLSKWKAKEITLVSRDRFAVQLPKEFFRTLRYQSAPVKNPSCDYMQGNFAETAPAAGGKVRSTDKDLDEHTVVPTGDEVHVFWICRSWKDAGSFCSDPANREGLSRVLRGDPAAVLKGKTLRYRIPTGSDPFRAEIRKRIEESMKDTGGKAEEVSYFFKNSEDADVELGFVVTPAAPGSSELAARWMSLSSRMGEGAAAIRDGVGEVFKFPMMVLLKRISAGDPFKKVFLEPDLETRKLPL